MSADDADVKSSVCGISSDVHERVELPDPAKFSGAASSDPISQFASVESDHISQFTSVDSFEQVSADGCELDETEASKLFADSSLPHAHMDAESINSGEMRRIFTGTDRLHDHDADKASISAGSSRMDVAGAVEVSPNLEHASALSAFNMSLPSSTPKFFWETDSFLSAVFGGETSVVDQLYKPALLKRPAPVYVDLSHKDDAETPIAKALRLAASRPIYMDSFSKASCENEDSKRKSFLSGWATLVLIDSSAFSAFDDAVMNTDMSERDAVLRCVTECLAAKATSTIGKRLGSLSRYAKFCEKKGIRVFPLSESSMYAYMNELYSDPASSASVGRSFLESIRFSAAILGLHGLHKDSVPQRVSGLAEMLTRRAPCIKQACPLTVQQVCKLEEVCCNSESLQDRVVTGGLLFMLYSCARASDVARVIKLVIDRADVPPGALKPGDVAGYIEAGALRTKGARSQAHKRSLLPLVAPMAGISGWRWWNSFLQAREALGIAGTDPLDGPLLCHFDEQGVPNEYALQASEIGCYLRNMLKIPHQKVNEVRSHSLKVTALSWMAKAGSSLAVRRSLGHHLDPAARSATIYARDAMAPALRELSRVVAMVYNKEFFPDCTRSGRFRKELSAGAVEATALDTDNETEESYELPFSDKYVGDTDDSQTDLSSDAACDSDEDILDTTTLWELVDPKHRPNLVKTKAGFETWMHKQSRVLHLLGENSRRFVCGRNASARYTAVMAGASKECTRCQTCYTNKNVVDEARVQLPLMDKI